VGVTHLEVGPPSALIQAVRASGGHLEAWWADLADPATIDPLFDQVERALGPVEVLVLNAAHWEGDTLRPEQAAVDWGGRDTAPLIAESHDRHFAVNSRATALLIAAYARRHAARGAIWGRVVTVSTDGADGFPGEVSYGASKAALESYSRAAARELAPRGITVNVVSPGATDTGWITPDLERVILPTMPAGRIGQPADIADVIVFLASEQARWISGQVIRINGGQRV
jgi:3-oxoacyl-[acyl-carrier protein] reductase